jgi:hypothetical protein
MGLMRQQGPFAGAGEQAFVAAAYATSQKTGQAQIFRNGLDSCRIVHRELITSVTGSVAFTVANTFPLNPGMNVTFPWLANEAAGWEKYKFNDVKFCYYTRTGSNVPGSLMLAPDYDASDAAPVSEVVASAYEDTEEDAPWKDICCHLQRAELMGDMQERYVRVGALAANQDVKTYDCGNMFVCTVDGTAVSWGKLWVEYDVTLITPHVPPGGFQAAGTLNGAGGSAAAATPFGAAPLSGGPVIVTNTGANNVVNISNVQIGQEIAVAAGFTGSVITGVSAGTLVGLTGKTVFSGGFSAAATTGTFLGTYTVTALNPSLDFVVTATTVTQCDMIVTVIAPAPAF